MCVKNKNQVLFPQTTDSGFVHDSIHDSLSSANQENTKFRFVSRFLFVFIVLCIFAGYPHNHYKKMFVGFGGSVTDTLQTVSERQTKVLLPKKVYILDLDIGIQTCS